MDMDEDGRQSRRAVRAMIDPGIDADVELGGVRWLAQRSADGGV